MKTSDVAAFIAKNVHDHSKIDEITQMVAQLSRDDTYALIWIGEQIVAFGDTYREKAEER